MSTSQVDSRERHDIARGESILYSAAFGPSLYGATIASVASVAHTSGGGGDHVTVGAAAINTAGPVSVDGIQRPTSTVVQFRVTIAAQAPVGQHTVTVSIVTSAGDTRLLRCLLRVV